MASVGSWDSILVLVLFVLTNVFMVFPVKVHICVPFFLAQAVRKALSHVRILDATAPSVLHDNPRLFWMKFRIDHKIAPIAAVLLLLATGAIRGQVVRDGILGADGVHPLDIMALFISLAYLSISLDATGLLRFLAFKVARKGGASGPRLHFYLYVFFLSSALIVGNDPVVLSGTAFLAYFTRVSGIVPPTAWTYAQFVAANMASAVLPPSNPTNLILTSAFTTPFTKFAGYTVTPVVVSAVVVYPIMTYWLFRSPPGLIPREIDTGVGESIRLGTMGPPGGQCDRPLDQEKREVSLPDGINDKFGAILGSVLLIGTLVILVATSPLPQPIPVWKITIPPALLMVACDFWHDARHVFWNKTAKLPACIEATDTTVTPEVSLSDDLRGFTPATFHAPSDLSEHNLKIANTLESRIRLLARWFPTIASLLPRLPFTLIPFALCMFILVNALATKGWVEVFADAWSSWIEACLRSGGEAGAMVGAATLMGFASVLLCNVCGTNIGATILLARVLKSWIQTSTPSNRVITVPLYTLALGSNYGAFSLHPGASLAGLLWRDILRRKGIPTRTAEFAKLNIWIVTVAMIVGTGIVVAEVFIVT